MMVEELLQELISKIDQRYYGKYRGYVSEVNDPESRGRIRARVPRLLGEDTPTGWALPASPYAGPDQGLFAVPELGAGVWIEFEEGDLSRPIWSGMWWGSPQAADINTADSTATRAPAPATQVAPEGAKDWKAPERQPETPQHEYPRQVADPKVRILKSASGHHIVLDDRPEYERIEIHDSKGNRLILSHEGLDRIMSNERTLNKGNRAARVVSNDELDLSGSQRTEIAGARTTKIGGNDTLEVGGDFKESIGNSYQRRVDDEGLTIEVSGQRTETVRGGVRRRVSGAIQDNAVGGYGMSSGGPVNVSSAGPIKLAAGLPDLSLDGISVSALAGNVSINTMLGMMRLGGMTAVSPLVLGDGLMIHLTMLAQILKAVNPLTVAAYGPALDIWATLTPIMDLSYFGFVKRFPVG